MNFSTKNHRIIEVGTDLLGSPSPSPLLLKQSQLDQVAKGHVQSGFEYVCRWRLHKLILFLYSSICIWNITKQEVMAVLTLLRTNYVKPMRFFFCDRLMSFVAMEKQ